MQDTNTDQKHPHCSMWKHRIPLHQYLDTEYVSILNIRSSSSYLLVGVFVVCARVPGTLAPDLPMCWTYSHYCQIADKNLSKRWNGEFRGFRICIGFVQRDFVLWVFVCSVNFSLFSGYHAEGYHAPPVSLLPATTPRATTPHRYPTSYHAQGYHALTTTARLSRLCIFPGYDAII